MPPYATIQKRLGETPLEAAERLRAALRLPAGVPLAYAGRLDPMATGTLLILIGDTCKQQEQFHSLDKSYSVELLLGIGSDTGDVLGIARYTNTHQYSKKQITDAARSFIGPIELPYPHFSSKTVRGKPLHTWTLEGRLGEITIPTKRSHIYRLCIEEVCTITKLELLQSVREKIESIPTVTDPRKALGKDFRRTEIRAAWQEFEDTKTQKEFQIVRFSCIASSGTYMRTLCEMIAKKLETKGLAYSIHRTTIGKFIPLYKNIGFWRKRF